MFVMFSVPVPGFDSVTVCEELLLFSSWLPNGKLVGDKLAEGVREPLEVVKLQVGPVVVYGPLETTAYQWYWVLGARPLQFMVACAPEATFETVPNVEYPLLGMLHGTVNW